MRPDFICDVCHQSTPEYHYGGQCKECHASACDNCIGVCTICGRSICRLCAQEAPPFRCKNKSACDQYREEQVIRRVLLNLASTGDEKKDAEIRSMYVGCPTCNALAKTDEMIACVNCDKVLCGKCARICPSCRKPYCRICKIASSQCDASCKEKPSPPSPPPASPSSRTPHSFSRKKKEPDPSAPPSQAYLGFIKFILWMGGRASTAHPIAINSPLGLLLFLPCAYFLALLGAILFSPVIGALGIMLQAAGMLVKYPIISYGSIFLAGSLFFGFEPQRPRLWVLLCCGAGTGAFLEYHFNLLYRFYDYVDYHSYTLDNMCQMAVITTMLLTSGIDIDETIAKKASKRPFHAAMAVGGGVVAIALWHLLYTRIYNGMDHHAETYIPPSAYFTASFLFFSMATTYFRLTERH